MSMFILFLGFLNFMYKSKQFILLLLRLELILILVYFTLRGSFLVIGFDLCFCIYYLILGVCERCLGLSLLIYTIRSFGEDYVKDFNLLI